MNQHLIRLSWLVGLTAILILAHIHTVVAFPLLLVLAKETAAKISFLIVLGIACWITVGKELVQRSKSETWVLSSMLACGLAFMLGQDVYGLLPGFLIPFLRFIGFSVVQIATSLGLVFLFFKSTSELAPFAESEERETGAKIRIFLGIAFFIAISVEFIPHSWLPRVKWDALLRGDFKSGPIWPLFVHWILAFAAAHFLVSKARIDERIDLDRPGLTMLKLGIVGVILVNVIGAITSASASTMSGEGALVIFVGLALVLVPLAVAAKLLLTFGTLRLLLGLQSLEVAPKTALKAASPTESPVAQPSETNPNSNVSAETGAGRTTPVAELAEEANPVSDLGKEYELRGVLVSDPLNTRLHERLHRALATDPSRAKDLLQHARQYLAALIGHSMKDEALALFRECFARDPSFKPAADQIWPMVRILLREKDAKTALRIMSRFDVENPGHPHTPQIYYLCAQILKGMHQPDRARQIIHLLLERYPTDKAAQDARALLGSIAQS